MSSFKENALRLTAQGFNVFPLVSNTKIPALKSWPEKATQDQEIVRLWWDQDPDYNIGIYTGSMGDGEYCLIAIDVDTKQDKPGLTTWHEIRDPLGLPRTRTNETATGGFHHIYKSKRRVKSTANRLGEAIDIRSDGGFIVGPGSIIDGNKYTSDWTKIVEAPAALVEACGISKVNDTPHIEPLGDLDTEDSIKRAVDWLVKGADHAIEGRGGDSTTYKVACKLKDFGISQLTALDLMFEHWNKEKASPSWSYEDLARKVSNAYTYGNQPNGIATAQADFEDVSDLIAPQKPKDKLYWVSTEDVSANLDQVHLIEDLLNQEGMSVIYGESNTGKTFIALKMGYCVATGSKFQKKRTEQGAVVYVAAESGRSVLDRVQGLKQFFNLDKFDMAIVPCPIDLLRPNGDTEELIDLIEDVSRAKGKVKFVIIDTLSRALSGGNENSPDDMGNLVRHLDKIRHTLKTHLCIIHHSGKDRARGARGHSLLRAATDTELEVANHVIRARKQRDMEEGIPIAFELITVDLGTNKYQKMITTCVMQETELPAESDFDDLDALSKREQIALDVFKDNENEDKELTLEDFRTHLEWTKDFFSKGSKNSFYRAVSRTVDSLVEKGRLEFNKQQQLIRRLVPLEDGEIDH